MALIGLHSLLSIWGETHFSLRIPRVVIKPVLGHTQNTRFQTSHAQSEQGRLHMSIDIYWYLLVAFTYIFRCKHYGLNHIFPCADHLIRVVIKSALWYMQNIYVRTSLCTCTIRTWPKVRYCDVIMMFCACWEVCINVKIWSVSLGFPLGICLSES